MGSIAETDTKLIIFSQTFILGVSKKTIPLITPKDGSQNDLNNVWTFCKMYLLSYAMAGRVSIQTK